MLWRLGKHRVIPTKQNDSTNKQVEIEKNKFRYIPCQPPPDVKELIMIEWISLKYRKQIINRFYYLKLNIN